MLLNPLALIGLVAIPALLTVYLLRNRVKHRTVSSLMLWAERSRMTNGGGWIQRNRLPLLFFLELLILLLLIWAAANPLRLSQQVTRPLVIVLDDSASMSAVGTDGLNVAQRALKQLPKLVQRERFSPVRIMIAGSEPHWLSNTSVESMLDGKYPYGWKLRAAAFQLDKALLLARENSTPSTKLLVVSDARPEKVPTSGNLRWQAFGTPLPNAGFMNAVRSGERCMVEIAGSGTTDLELRMGEQTKTVSIELPARKIYKLTDRFATFEAALPNDALAIDNQVVLLPEPETQLRIQQIVQHPELRELVARSIAATGFETEGTPELLITDTTATLTNLDTWVLHIVPVKNAVPFTGPFVVDRDSPLMNGLSFEGLVWAGSESNALPGMPVVLAGNIPLLTQQDDLAGRSHFYLQIDPSLSTLQHSPVWPTLFWNLLKARAALQPGFKEVNLRPGMTLEGKVPDEPGIIEVELDGKMFRAAYNFMDAEESDLTDRGRGDDGSWVEPETVEREYAELAPLIILAAIGLLAVHQILLRREIGIAV